jgi:hypothetical protein
VSAKWHILLLLLLLLLDLPLSTVRAFIVKWKRLRATTSRSVNRTGKPSAEGRRVCVLVQTLTTEFLPLEATSAH